jgi:hypothetical protein
MKKMKALTGSVRIGAATVEWFLLRTGHEDETGDVDVRDHDSITISAAKAPLDDMARAVAAAKQLKFARHSPMICPHSDAWMQAVGLDDMGGVVLQIYRGDAKKSAAPVRELAHMDPANYSGGGPEAVASVAWMRDVARAVRDATTLAGMRDAIFHASVPATEAARA